MTMSAKEHAAVVADERVRTWRKWRRSMHLTIVEAAACAGVSGGYLKHVESGAARLTPRTAAKLEALMSRWDESKRPTKKPDGRGRWPRKPKAAKP
jgi:transcriptional regulator with XRE-family HTH domain